MRGAPADDEEREVVGVEGVLVGRRVAADLAPHLLVLAQHELEHARAGTVELKARHLHPPRLVHGRVAQVLRALDEPEDDGVFLTNQAGADVVQRQAVGFVDGHAIAPDRVGVGGVGGGGVGSRRTVGTGQGAGGGSRCSGVAAAVVRDAAPHRVDA